MGQAAKVVMESAHAAVCAARTWVLNEKRLVERAGLVELQPLFSAVPQGARELPASVAEVGARLPR